MLTTRHLRPQVRQMTFLMFPQCGYHWGNYDASSGECCKMQTDCTQKTPCGKVRPIANVCNLRVDDDMKLAQAFPKQLMEILQRKQSNEDCDFFRHDMCYYQPSDKTRRYQRTWCECPRIWLRPKPVCCFDKDYALPIERRPKPPPMPELSAAEMYAFQMDQICKYTDRMGHKRKQKCHVVRIPQDCVKTKAPFPSFSECQTECIPQFCPTECACKMKPSLCDMWKLYHHTAGNLKHCTQANIYPCTLKNRARPQSSVG
ncbi:hypothetical protein ACLKA7_013663 [Drosophila subpalustris]